MTNDQEVRKRAEERLAKELMWEIEPETGSWFKVYGFEWQDGPAELVTALIDRETELERLRAVHYPRRSCERTNQTE